MSEKISSFTQLRTWQKARQLAVQLYRLAESFPASERFGLSSQVKRAAASIAANIAEGFSRNGKRDKIQFYAIALGSLTETVSHCYIAFDLGYLSKDDLHIIESESTDLHKMINGLIKSAQERNNT